MNIKQQRKWVILLKNGILLVPVSCFACASIPIDISRISVCMGIKVWAFLQGRSQCGNFISLLTV